MFYYLRGVEGYATKKNRKTLEDFGKRPAKTDFTFHFSKKNGYYL